MKSGHLPHWLAAAGFEPVGRGECDGIFGQHGGQAGEHVREVFLWVDAQTSAVFDAGVEDGALLAGHFIADEQPVLGSKFGRAYRVFDEVVADFHTSVAKVGFEVGPLADGIADGFPEFAFGEDGTTESELVEDFLDAPVDYAAFGGANGFTHCWTGFGVAQPFFDMIEVDKLSEDPGDETRRLVHGFEKLAPHMGVAAHEFDPCLFLGPCGIDDVAIALDDAQQRDDFRICRRIFLGGTGFLEESIHALGVAPVMPMIEHGTTGDVGRPKVSGLGFAAAGFEVINGCFVNLSVKGPPMFILDFAVNDGEPVGSQQRPVAEGFAMEFDPHSGEHILLPVVRQMADETVVNHLGNESGSGNAALLQAGWQRIDDRVGGGIILAHVFATHELDAEEFGRLVVELLTHFLANAPEAFGIGHDLGWVECFSNNRKVFRNAGSPSLFLGGLLVARDFSRRSWVCGNGGGSFLCETLSELEFKLGRIEFLARYAEDPAAESVDGLLELDDFGSLARDDLVALCDLVTQLLDFVADANLLGT
jgi:hypothetical protein